MQSEHYVEYSEDGRVVKGQEKAIPRTKYVEDVLENNHKGIWGSFFDLTSGRWVSEVKLIVRVCCVVRTDRILI